MALLALAGALVALTAALNGLPLAPLPARLGPRAHAASLRSAALLAHDSWAASLQVAMPADRQGAALAPCARAVRPAGWLARENALPGVHGFRLPVTTSRTAGGYLDRWSVTCGQTVRLHLSGPVGVATVEAYRLGWYRGAGARLVWHSAPVAVSPQRQATPAGPLRVIEERWPVSLSFRVTTAWTPGLYVLVPRTASGQSLGVVPLVVRDDAGHEPLLVKESLLTWLAYNDFGGANLYDSDEGRTRGLKLAARSLEVSLARPMGPSAWDQIAHTELPLVPFIESLGVDVAYTTDLEVDSTPSLLLRHAALVSGGHSEYWTRRMYDAVEAARNRGLNLAFLGANNVYWQMRLDASPRGPVRGIVYRHAALDPVSRTDPAATTTRWTDGPLYRNPAALLGQTYAAIRVRGASMVLHGPAWLLRGSGATDGTIVPGLVGRESDAAVRGPWNPPTNQVVAEALLRGPARRVVRWATPTVNYYTAPSGAAVFAAGSMYWVCQLDGSCRAATGATAATQRFVRAVTGNLLRELARPRAGARHPAQPSPPVSAAQMQQILPAWAVGVIRP